MASCSVCGTTILFGGVKQGELRFCNAACQSKGGVLAAAAVVPDDVARNAALQIHHGDCPRCKGPGPVDIHPKHWAWSALAFTRYGSQTQMSCRPCAVKSQVGNLLFTSLLGWWGFPFGLLLTPVQVIRNVVAIASPPDPSQPSAQLVQVARLHLASQPRT